MYSCINDDAVRFFLYVQRTWAMTAFTVDAQREFLKDIDRAFFGFWHSCMATHAFDIDLAVEACIEFFITWWQIPDAFLGIEGEGCLIEVLAIGPKVTVRVLSTSNDVGDFLSTIVDGIPAMKPEFLDVQ